MTEPSVPEKTLDAEVAPETGHAPAPGRGKAGVWTAVGVSLVALIVGGLSLAAHIQPQFLGLTAAVPYDPAPQQTALASLSARLEQAEAQLSDAAQTVDALTLKQASITAMASRTDSLVQEMDAVASRLDDARQRIDEVAEGVGDTDVGTRLGALTEDVQGLKALIAGADGNVQASEERLVTKLAALEARVDDLSSRTRLLEVVQPEHVAGAAAVALAVGQLRAAVLSGQPFSAPLSSVKSILAAEGGATPAVAETLRSLDGRASAGVMTLSVLRERFASNAGAVLRAGTLEAEGWMDQTLRRLTAVVTVRRTGEVSGSGTEAILARAETRLDEGDLIAAVAELSALTDAPAAAADAWLESGRARLGVESALADLEAYAVSRVATIGAADQADGTSR
jgi:hypothetical protein